MRFKFGELCLDRVSTTCGSGWVRRRRARIQKPAHPPATAGGTDPVQVGFEVLKGKQARPLGVESAKGAQYAKAPKARNMIARGKREARRPWLD